MMSLLNVVGAWSKGGAFDFDAMLLDCVCNFHELVLNGGIWTRVICLVIVARCGSNRGRRSQGIAIRSTCSQSCRRPTLLRQIGGRPSGLFQFHWRLRWSNFQVLVVFVLKKNSDYFGF